jgi:hypothetical protein
MRAQLLFFSISTFQDEIPPDARNHVNSYHYNDKHAGARLFVTLVTYFYCKSIIFGEPELQTYNPLTIAKEKVKKAALAQIKSKLLHLFQY